MNLPHDDRLWRAYVNGLMLLASSNESRGEYDSALTIIQRAIELVEAQRLELNDQDVELIYLRVLTLCGSLQRQLANYPQAEVTLQHALDVAVATFGEAEDTTSGPWCATTQSFSSSLTASNNLCRPLDSANARTSAR